MAMDPLDDGAQLRCPNDGVVMRDIDGGGGVPRMRAHGGPDDAYPDPAGVPGSERSRRLVRTYYAQVASAREPNDASEYSSCRHMVAASDASEPRVLIGARIKWIRDR